MGTVLGRASVAVINETKAKGISEMNRLISVLQLVVHHPGKTGTRGGHWKQGLKQNLWGRVAYWLVPRDLLPRLSWGPLEPPGWHCPLSWVLPHQSLSKEIPHPHTFASRAAMGVSSQLEFLSFKTTHLCRVDVELSGTHFPGALGYRWKSSPKLP